VEWKQLVSDATGNDVRFDAAQRVGSSLLVPRLNGLIDCIENGRVASGGYPINFGNFDDAVKFAGLGYDWVLVDSEHVRYDAQALEITLQFLVDRTTLASGRRPPTPLVRIPPNARERNQWIIKQVLDMGAFGVVVPAVETVGDARAAVAAMRYPRPADAPVPEVVGERGINPARAARYWGLSTKEYYDVADLWPLDPFGELMFVPLIETATGVENLSEILEQVQGISAVLTGAGDLSATLGHFGESGHPAVESAFERIASVCARFHVPCGIVQPAAPSGDVSATADLVQKRVQQGYQMILSSPSYVDPVLLARRQLAQRGGM